MNNQTTEEGAETLKPEEIPFTQPHLLRQFVTDTGKILPQKYTHLTSKQQRIVTRTIKRARNLLLAQ